MVEIGTMTIVGELDSSDIDDGLLQLKLNFSQFEGNVNSSFASMFKLTKVAKTFANTLIRIGTVGVSALVGIASVAPAVAPAIAKMQVEFFKLSQELGQTLRPLFESVANDLIPAIGEALDANRGKIKGLVDVGVQGITDISNVLTGDFQKIDSLFPKTAVFAAFALAGLAIGRPFLGAALGLAVAEGAISTEADRAAIPVENFVETIEEDASKVKAAGTQLITGKSGNPFTFFKEVGSLGQALAILINDLIVRGLDDQSVFTGKNEVPRGS